MKINENYLKLGENYLFAEIAKRVKAHKAANPDKEIIRLGIGDVTLPLVPTVVEALKKAGGEMGAKETFRGYDDEQGYAFLKEAVAAYYAAKNVALNIGEIFIGDGAKSDLSNITDIFGTDNTALIPNPVYPVYADTNLMNGRKIVYARASKENGFLPLPDSAVKADIIYLCSPNNPTGAVYDAADLKLWVDYALKNDAVILFDAAYECFVSDEALPTSIFQIEGAKECAIEFCSLSKTAGFTGVRCGYTVVPEALARGGVKLNALWRRRQATKFNGVSYIVQRGAEAVFSPAGMVEIRKNIAYYMDNANVISRALTARGAYHTGGKNSPYIWFECFGGLESWEFFDRLLTSCGVVGTPGAGFGDTGKNFFRLTAFNSRENTLKAVQKLAEFKA
ncbi:MAG: LL-diaminopimelate aminotransferase [Clostridiales bacterium]|jgi:LL-diaminopimelate aminotransferase|nr:LL-diaminopimelate aminotransferase [Clostridiales bacterium]